MNRIIPVGILTLAILLSGAISFSYTREQDGSSFAPDFRVTDLTGKTISLSDYRGKVVFLNFRATWAPPCRTEIPDFIEAYAENKANGLEILGISLDLKGKAEVSAFVEKYKPRYLALGIEVNVLYEKSHTDFELFVQFYNGRG